jgi:transposase
MEGVKLKGHLLMSERERERMKVLARVKKGEMKLVAAADLLKLSYRHVKRVYGRYREQGDKGLIHQARGRQSNRGIRKEFKKEVIELYQKALSLASTTADMSAQTEAPLTGWFLQAGSGEAGASFIELASERSSQNLMIRRDGIVKVLDFRLPALSAGASADSQGLVKEDRLRGCFHRESDDFHQ